ncbi:MAG: glycosyltransferase family 39 protein [Candidatus Riflebacteria bacterium]|nr:glycosyltransferase family 39 protein [Candidatus Riflebacteria bacterium]
MQSLIPENHWKYIFFAFAINIFLRGILFFAVFPEDHVLRLDDQGEYLSLAEAIEKTGFDENFKVGRTPTYPLFLYICSHISKSLFFPIIVQHGIGLGAIFFVYLSGFLFSEKIALFSLFLGALNFNFIVLSNYLLSDSLYYPMFCVLYFFILRFYLLGSTVTNSVALGVVLGFSILIRPVSMYMPFFIIPFIIWTNRKMFRKGIIHSLIFLFSVSIILCPWFYRNYKVYHAFGLTNFGYYQLMTGIIPGVMMGVQNISFREAQEKAWAGWEKEKTKIPMEIQKNPFEIDSIGKEYALKTLWSYPITNLLFAWGWGAARNLFSPEIIEISHLTNWEWSRFADTKGSNYLEKSWNFIFSNKNSWYSALFCFGCFVVILLRIVQTIGATVWMKQDPVMVIFLLVNIVYFLLLMGPYGSPKYRLPFEPILIIFGAFGIQKLFLKDYKASENNEKFLSGSRS